MAEASKSNRRDFLRGKAAVEAIADVAAGIGEAVGNPSAGGSIGNPDGVLARETTDAKAGYLLRIGRRAMACEFEVLLNAGQYSHGAEAALAALDLVDELESQLTVYRETSEISRLNRNAFAQSVKVEPRLFELLKQAAEIHRATGGAYDIATGVLTKLWGFYRREGRVPSDTELAATMNQVGMRQVELDETAHSIKFRTDGVEINLGSIGKGYALDRAAESLTAAGIENFLLHGGNSSVLARGTEGLAEINKSPDDQTVPSETCGGWWVGLRHPLRAERRIGEILLRNRALGTSGSGTQFFVHQGKRYGHLLDPRAGRPAEGTLSTTVAAPSGAQADALATAFYVLGKEGSIEFCRQHPGVSAVIMSLMGDGGLVDVALWGFAADEIRIYDDRSLVVNCIS
jgi:thiamine biosynthesis lipoprotein